MKHLNPTVRSLMFCTLALLTGAAMQAQDIHFSQYNASPLTLNPAQAGNFNCDFRAGVNYRNQWASVASPFVTYSAFADMPVKAIKGFDEGDQIGAGIYLFNDRAGGGIMSNFQAVLSAAYHKSLGQNSRISLGVGLGFMQKSLDQSQLTWGTQWTGDGFDPTQASLENFAGGAAFGNFNLDLGLMFKSSALDGRLSYEAGGTIFHLTTPEESFLDGGESQELGMRYLGHARAIYMVNDKVSLQPTVLYMNQSKAQETILGSDFGYLINSGSFMGTASIGAHYRLGDAVIAAVGLDYQNFRFGFSYDITTSSLTNAVNGGVGGFEMTLVYRACALPVIPKEYIMPCPRY
jgi:type IX secretion system PorP/SprF family membrane protein